MNIHSKEPWEPHYENMAEAVDRLAFLAEVLGEHYGLCPHCLVVALHDELMAQMEKEDDDER